MKYRNRPVRIRLGICLVVFLLAFVALTVRVWQLQLILDRRVVKLQERQDEHRYKLSAQRGSILDARGRALAVSLRVPSVFADPTKLHLSHAAKREISKLLKISARHLERKFAKKKHFVWLKRQVAPEVGSKLKKLNLPGIGVTQEWGRLYPSREIGAQVIGVVGIDGEGLEGIERFYDPFLRSRPLSIRTHRDAKGRSIFTGQKASREAESGATLHLSLDTTIQHFVENELFSAARISKSKSAMGIVMDPSNGRILAMASYPSVNPNRLSQTVPEQWRNRPVEDVFEPGSTFKVFTLAAALEEGRLPSGRVFNCQEGSLVVRGKVIRNAHKHGWLDPSQIMKFSDNVGVARIGLELGHDPLIEWISKFGFGHQTGIDFPGEEKGLILRPKRWREMEIATVSFGQGIGVTALQVVTALSSIANGGLMVRPHLVDFATLTNGKRVDFSRTYEAKRVLRQETARQVQQWMERVTEPDGTGALAAMATYRVAGKTGTAQMIDPETKRYSHDHVVSSFMGYAPASSPKLAAIFAFRQPERADFGGRLAAPVFRRAISSSLAYLGISPDKDPDVTEVPFLEASRAGGVKETPEAQKDRSDFRGLTIREALKRAKDLSLNVNIVGSGVAVRQELKKTQEDQQSSDLTIYFAGLPSKERT